MKFFNKKNISTNKKSFSNAYYVSNKSATWSAANYYNFATKGYIKNPIVHKAIATVATNVANIKLLAYKNEIEILNGGIVNFLKKPNPFQNYFDFMEDIVTQLYISGNVYINFIVEDDIIEGYVLRSDRVSILTNDGLTPSGYVYKVCDKEKTFFVDQDTFKTEICHIKMPNPIDDWYGLSPIETAQYPMEQHNQCIEWNKSLLEGGARPSGALVVKNEQGYLNDEEFETLKSQIRNQISGAKNAGNIMLLEGGLEWQEMSVSPKDMDFIETKNSAARDIALALNIPPQLLGIKGDNTYSNLNEARISFWEETVIPVSQKIASNINRWIVQNFDSEIFLDLDYDKISSLSGKRMELWAMIKDATFITDDEKREMLGFGKK